MSFGTWMVIDRIGYMIYVGSDIIVLKKFATAVDVTNYKLGAELYMQIQAMISLSLGTLLPALTAMYAQKDWERLRASYLRGCRYILWLTMLVSCPVFVYAPELIRLFVGDLYQGAVPVMRMRLLLLPLMQTIALLSR
jgi:O-antigen/teichoic acid export membrane protein